jgi:2-methylisocitrate lyase-like PEP mutase family enzyme
MQGISSIRGCAACQWLRKRGVRSVTYGVNSLRIGTGNFLRPCRELNQATREISALIRETAMTAKRLTGSGTRR